MTVLPDRSPPAPAPKPAHQRRRRRSTAAPASLIAQGEPIGWLMGGALGFSLAMIVGLLGLVLYFGASTFWPRPLVQVTTTGGKVYLGEVTRTETYDPSDADVEAIARSRLAFEMSAESKSPSDEEVAQAAAALRKDVKLEEQGGEGWRNVLWIIEAALVFAIAGCLALFVRRMTTRLVAGLAACAALALGIWGIVRVVHAPDDRGGVQRYLLRSDNVEQTGFRWISELEIREREYPEWAVQLERFHQVNFYGVPHAFQVRNDDLPDKPLETVADTPEESWREFTDRHDEVLERNDRINQLREHELGRISSRTDDALLEMIQAELDYGRDSTEYAAARQHHEAVSQQGEQDDAEVNSEIDALEAKNARYVMIMRAADGEEVPIPLADIVRAFPANRLSWAGQVGVYFSRWGEFLADNPRQSNTKGGVFPAIVGTVAMTFIMALLVVPFGVLAALYLREYAKSGPIVSAIRIAVNNLAGVPSIVFGVFGLGFFCYYVGAYIDAGPENVGIRPLPPARWYWWLAALAVISTGAFFMSYLSLAGRQGEKRHRRTLFRWMSFFLWLAALVAFCIVLIYTPYFDGFYEAELKGSKNDPTFGKGGMLWASLTLALLTLPVVIVSTEEALSAVPNSMREGSYACGASKWQTIKRIVLPRAMPGIMTGMILAMARGAGEVAPLMLVGVRNKVTALPVDGQFPFVHADRSFMHLGFQIYDVGFQSPNSEAAKSLVFTTTLLLILVIATLNLFAVWLRGRLRRKFVNAQF